MNCSTTKLKALCTPNKKKNKYQFFLAKKQAENKQKKLYLQSSNEFQSTIIKNSIDVSALKNAIDSRTGWKRKTDGAKVFNLYGKGYDEDTKRNITLN